MLTRLAIAACALVACVGDSSQNNVPPGSLGGTCLSSGTCNAGLVCVLQGNQPVCEVANDGAPPDASAESDAAVVPDASDASDGATASTYNDITSQSFWTLYDTTNVNVKATGFAGGAFDGRYLYLASHTNNGIVARFDTQATFGNASSWSMFDTTAVHPSAAAYGGSVFDGRYVYFVPLSGGGANSGLIVRYDTQSSFTSNAAWKTFDLATVNAKAKGFDGATFDGRYIYLAPIVDSVVARYDTQATFDVGASWSMFDTRGISANAYAFLGAVFDGHYAYFLPHVTGIVARVDTTTAFTQSSSWSVFDATTVQSRLTELGAGAFDGRYLYAVPGTTIGTSASIIARYDTQAGFATKSSWSAFDVSTVTAKAAGYTGATFDGRYLYLTPFATNNCTMNGTVMRLDTQAPFGSASSWSNFDLTSLAPNAKGYVGSIFDGHYVYFVPFSYACGPAASLVARFDAKSPASMPTLPSFYGSFY